MLTTILTVIVLIAAGAGTLIVLFTRRGIVWGSTPAERTASMAGDAFLAGGPPARLVMTRAISIQAPPQAVWPWLAQLGRGAGWYSIDRLDNGGRSSARHLGSWIPDPCLGDASAIGYLRHLDPGRELVWWVKGERWFGTTLRMVSDYLILPEGNGTRLVARYSGDATGFLARPILSLFSFIDTIMARSQLAGIKQRAESDGARRPDPSESGTRDQYQLYEVVYANREKAGVSGHEKASLWRQAAIEDGVIPKPPSG